MTLIGVYWRNEDNYVTPSIADAYAQNKKENAQVRGAWRARPSVVETDDYRKRDKMSSVVGSNATSDDMMSAEASDEESNRVPPVASEPEPLLVELAVEESDAAKEPEVAACRIASVLLLLALALASALPLASTGVTV